MRKDSGFTLYEVLITMGIFSLFVTIISMCFVQGLRNYRQGTEDAPYFRKAANSFDLMASELRQAKSIYIPDNYNTLAAGFSLTSGTPIFVFVRDYYDGAARINQTIGYKLDTINHYLTRIIYLPDFNPNDPSKWGTAPNNGIKKVAEAIQYLNFQYDPQDSRSTKQLLNIELQFNKTFLYNYQNPNTIANSILKTSVNLEKITSKWP
ncbi:MAG: prepilin-type N-terminal cleavage/methylation domain-containing protein [Armatimonadetes bacterium]|nr:prepilin-type N-terminal cleavage/methylation domain-containing protein [Armatimonadota bacterium]